MFYEVKIKQIITKEVTVYLEALNAIDAMERAEKSGQYVDDVLEKSSNWHAVSVKESDGL